MNDPVYPQATRLEQLDAILLASLTMLDHARAKDWEGLEALEVQRRGRVAECFRQSTPAHEAQEVANYITRILDVNQEITALAVAQKQEVGNNIHQLGAGKTASKAYRQHAR